ncbi:MAG: DNA polymerase III subunit gamma and tau [Propionibacteriaceae bacterium]|nr:DNA polymerase III subunit gamma and tau [Propionibacteriaceae bacterium]
MIDDDVDGLLSPEDGAGSDLFEQDGPGLFDVAPEPPKTKAAKAKGRRGASADATPAEPAAAVTERQPTPAEPPPAAPAGGPRDVVPREAVPEPPLALYRRYRPDVFAEVIGQEHVTEPLRRALANNRVNHAYLFSGPRGCGKTTSARILARALNCEQGPTPDPCGECDSCRELATGGPGSIDVVEIDAASHGGVDEARDLRERVFFAPVRSRYKVYIIDEAHMVTPQGFNALLKVVEEPPPHVKFIFATTEPDKVIGTIRSRTHHYPFRLVPPKVLSDYLAGICAKEGVTVEQGVLGLVVRAGGGSVRDSLSVLDQLLGSAGAHGVEYRTASALLGYTPDSLLDEFVDALAAGDAHGVFATVDKVVEAGQEPRRFAEDLLTRLRDLIIAGSVEDAFTSGLIEVPEDQAERYRMQAKGLGHGELTRAAEVMAAGLTAMRGTTAPRLQLELMCARLLLPGADAGERGLHARLDRLERRLGMMGPADAAGGAVTGGAGVTGGAAMASTAAGRPDGRASAAGAAGPAGPALGQAAPAGEPVATGPAVSPPSRPEPMPMPRVDPIPGAPAPAPTASAAAPAWPPAPRDPRPAAGPSVTAPAAPSPAPAAGPATGAGALDVTELRRHWPAILEAIKNRRKFTWFAVQQAQVTDLTGKLLWLTFSNPGARMNFAGRGEEDLQAVIAELLGANVVVRSRLESDPPPRAEGDLTVVPGNPEARPGPAPRGGRPDLKAVASPPSPVASARSAAEPAEPPDDFEAPPEEPGDPEEDFPVPPDVAPDDRVVPLASLGEEAEKLVETVFDAELISAEDN